MEGRGIDRDQRGRRDDKRGELHGKRDAQVRRCARNVLEGDEAQRVKLNRSKKRLEEKNGARCVERKQKTAKKGTPGVGPVPAVGGWRIWLCLTRVYNQVDPG